MKFRKLFLLLIIATSFKSIGQSCYEVVGYYPSWQWYDRNKLVNPQTIDYSKYTILNYAFLKPEVDGSISLFDSWADENLLLGQNDWVNGGYVPNTSLISNAHMNGVKVLPSIGGWTLSNNFPGIAADPTKRATFAQACVDLIQTYGFDGIDLDWEYPGFADHGGTPQDFQNFALLLQAVRTAIDNYGSSIGKPMLLTAAVGAAADKMDDVDWANVELLLDIINLMSYDFFGTWDSETNHNSPLFAPSSGDQSFNVAASVERLINVYGVNPDKITAGIAFYGRSTKTVSTPGLHVPITGLADNITFAADEGTPLYYNLLQSLNLFTENWDSSAEVPYLTGNNGLNTFVSYDNEASIALKAQYIVEQSLRGAIVWEITGDYIETFPGSGVIAETPLIDELNDVLCNYTPNGSSAGIEEELIRDLLIYPNPTSGIVKIKAEDGAQGKIIISNLVGECIKSFEVNSSEFSIDLNSFPAGSYVVTFNTINGESTSRLVQKY
jgi:chitinase